MKFTFKSEFVGFGSPQTTMEFEVDQLEDVLVYFEQFLKGCGYELGNGHLDIVYDEEQPPYIYDNFDPPTPEEKRDIDDDNDGRC